MSSENKFNNPFVIYHVTFDRTRLVDSNGQYHPDIKTYDAQRLARDAGKDLVCFNKDEKDQLALCKIVDFGKWKYEEEKRKKKELKSRKKETKEVRFTASIEDNDINNKFKKINEFLVEGDDVVLTMKVFGRDRNYMTEAEAKMSKIASMCLEHGKEVGKKRDGFVIIIRLASSGKKLNKTV